MEVLDYLPRDWRETLAHSIGYIKTHGHLMVRSRGQKPLVDVTPGLLSLHDSNLYHRPVSSLVRPNECCVHCWFAMLAAMCTHVRVVVRVHVRAAYVWCSLFVSTCLLSCVYVQGLPQGVPRITASASTVGDSEQDAPAKPCSKL